MPIFKYSASMFKNIFIKFETSFANHFFLKKHKKANSILALFTEKKKANKQKRIDNLPINLLIKVEDKN